MIDFCKVKIKESPHENVSTNFMSKEENYDNSNHRIRFEMCNLLKFYISKVCRFWTGRFDRFFFLGSKHTKRSGLCFLLK